MKPLKFKKRYKIVFGIILFLVITLFALPRVARWYIVKHGHELTGRDLAVKKIRINYFTGTLRINDLQVFESDSKTVFLSFKRFKINLDYLPLLKNEFYVKDVSLEDPYIQVVQDGSKFNFSDLTAADTTTTVVKDTIPAKPTKYIINNIRISGGYVKYTDASINHTIALDKLDLLIPGFTWNSDSTNLDVNFDFVDGGGLYSSLSMNQADSTYTVNLRLDSLNLDIIEPYLKSNMNISALHGYLTNDLLIKGSMQSVMNVFMKGINHVFGFQLLDTLNRTIFSFKNLTVDIDSIQLNKNKIRLNYIGLTDPFILFEMHDSVNNWSSLMKPSVEETDSLHKESDTATVAEAGSYIFKKLEITGGKVQFSDKTLRYPFDYSIDNLKIESAAIPGVPDKLTLNMSAALNGTGTFSADAILNPNDLNSMDLGLEIGQFRMKDVDSYFRHYFGFPVTGGIMNFKTENKIRPSSLISDNIIYFRKFTLAERNDNNARYKIPLRLALGILSDKNGIIDLKAPVETKGQEVKVRNLGKIIFRIIGNLFAKAAVSPFKALSGLYKVDPSSLQEIALSLTEPSPDNNNMKSVDIIADILTKKPGLDVDFIYCIDKSKATDSLAYIMAMDKYLKYARSIGINPKNVEDSTLLKYLKDKLTSSSPEGSTKLSDLCRNFIGTASLSTKLDSIKILQTGFITNYLTHDKEISADRFRIIGNAPDTIKPSIKHPSFRVYFNAAGEK